MKRSRKIKLLPPDCLAIHLRVGDVLDLAPKHDSILEIINQNYLDKKCTSCALFYGFQTQDEIKDNKQSLDYVNNFIELLKQYNFSVQLFSGSVDNDFVLLSTAKFYIAGYRGFGWLSASINSGNVYWDLHNPPHFNWVIDKLNLPECIRGYLYQKTISEEVVSPTAFSSDTTRTSSSVRL